VNPNLWTSHIIILNETKTKNVHLNSEIYNSLSQKFHVLSCYDEYDIMVIYDDNVSLIKNTTITNSGAKFITTLFNDNTWKTNQSSTLQAFMNKYNF
jgi:hypothetical protein